MSSAMVDPRRRYPDRPVVDDETGAVLCVAVNDVIMLRSPMWHGDAGAVLHAMASLADTINAYMPDAVADARDQDYTWAEIAQLLGDTKASIKQRYARHANSRTPPLDHD
jgi:hypothetical protein